jgi:hypothetical protein
MHVECPRNCEEENDAIVPKLPENVHCRKVTTRDEQLLSDEMKCKEANAHSFRREINTDWR